MDHWTLFLLFGILLVLGVRVLFDSLILGLFLRVFLPLALGPPGYSFLGSLHARLLASLPMFLGLKHAQLSKVNIFLYYYITRISGHYAPILLVPAEGWGPFGPLGVLRALLGAFSPLFHSKRYQNEHAQSSGKIGHNNIFLGS